MSSLLNQARCAERGRLDYLALGVLTLDSEAHCPNLSLHSTRHWGPEDISSRYSLVENEAIIRSNDFTGVPFAGVSASFTLSDNRFNCIFRQLRDQGR